jgi:hypothetical protein
MQTSVDKGNLSLLKVMTACSSAGHRVSLPMGDGHPYDLVLDIDNKLLRCQVKTARYQKGCLIFNTASNNGRYQKKEVQQDRTTERLKFSVFIRQFLILYILFRLKILENV